MTLYTNNTKHLTDNCVRATFNKLTNYDEQTTNKKQLFPALPLESYDLKCPRKEYFSRDKADTIYAQRKISGPCNLAMTGVFEKMNLRKNNEKITEFQQNYPKDPFEEPQIGDLNNAGWGLVFFLF